MSFRYHTHRGGRDPRLAIQFWQKRSGGRRNAQRRHPRANGPIRYRRLSWCDTLDNATQGVVVIDFPDDRN
jgi:hypothetical protein